MKIYLTVRQNQRFVGTYTLDDTKVRRSLESQFDAFSFEDIHEFVVVCDHFK